MVHGRVTHYGLCQAAFLSCTLFLVLGNAAQIRAQDAPSASPKPDSDAKTEVSIQDSGTTFHLNVNLVQVHVIVRDSKDKPIENLRKEDFLLYDQGKLQTISTFAVETRETRRAKSEAATKTQLEDGETGKGTSIVLPDRFVALVFDDSHLEMQDIAYIRVQVNKFIDGLPATDRVAIYSTSGQLSHGFTSDKAELKKTVLGLLPHPRFVHSTSDCPDVSHYEADQVENKSNTQVLAIVATETLQCAFNNDPRMMIAAQSMAQGAISRALNEGDTESEYVYRYLNDVLGHVAGMPGERVMVLVSPGFLLTTQNLELSALVDRANRSNIVINTIDGRGLYTPDLMGDISQPSGDTIKTVGYKTSYRVE